jgi:hypothetical protein
MLAGGGFEPARPPPRAAPMSPARPVLPGLSHAVHGHLDIEAIAAGLRAFVIIRGGVL